MRVLALDTALAHAQAAVLDARNGEARALGTADGPARGEAERIGEHVDAALARAGLRPSDIERIVVTVGPGSFTGVRVGLAFALGFGTGWGAPVLGVTTLEGLARTFAAPCVAAIDARHGALYAGHFGTDGAMRGAAKMDAGEAAALANREGVPLIGPQEAIAVAGTGMVCERIDLLALAAPALEDPARRPPRATYLSAVDARPQSGAALARV